MRDRVEVAVRELAASYAPAAAWDARVSSFGSYLHEGPGEDPFSEVAARIERCMRIGRAASFVRLGDGEGNVLAAALGWDEGLVRHYLELSSFRHLGTRTALEEALPELLPRYKALLGNADLIGFPGPFGIKRMLAARNPDLLRPVAGLIAVHEYLITFREALGLAEKVGAPAGFHRGLLPHYRGLVSGRAIGIVTCHEQLEAALVEKMGAKRVDLRRVPRQAKYASNEEKLEGTGHWPARFHELQDELAEIPPGGLWLVAAGMLGKVYCETIRSAGGIAVDIGHAADIWAGLGSRMYDQDDVLERWRLVD